MTYLTSFRTKEVEKISFLYIYKNNILVYLYGKTNYFGIIKKQKMFWMKKTKSKNKIRRLYIWSGW
jgi:hypothetical protein